MSDYPNIDKGKYYGHDWPPYKNGGSWTDAQLDELKTILNKEGWAQASDAIGDLQIRLARTGNPAQLLAQKPRKRSPEAVEQSRQAASKPRPNAKGKPKETFCKVCGKAIMVKGTQGYCDEHRPTSTPQ